MQSDDLNNKHFVDCIVATTLHWRTVCHSSILLCCWELIDHFFSLFGEWCLCIKSVFSKRFLSLPFQCVCVFFNWVLEMCLWFTRKEFQRHLHGFYKLITWAMLVADLVTWLGHVGDFMFITCAFCCDHMPDLKVVFFQC